MYVCKRVAVGCGWEPVYRAVSESGLRMKTNHSQRKRQEMPKLSTRTHTNTTFLPLPWLICVGVGLSYSHGDPI